MRRFEFLHLPYDRHENLQAVAYRKKGLSLLDAFKKLPHRVLVNVLGQFSEKSKQDPIGSIIQDYRADDCDFDDKALINLLDNLEYGMTDGMVVSEVVNDNLVRLAGVDYRVEEDTDQEW